MRVNRYLIFFCAFILSCSVISLHGYAQSYGLGFLSHETVQDNRTRLDLSPGKQLCFNDSFELSFDFGFLPNRPNYFGYILRLINNDKQNIDMLYDRRFNDKHFKIIIGDSISKQLSFNMNENLLLTGSTWVRFTIKVDVKKQLLTFVAGGQQYTQRVKFDKSNCFKMLFGANDYLDYKTNDVPPIKLRDITITEAGKITYRWPLNQSKGNNTTDEVNDAVAQVENPLWIKKLHSNWQPLKQLIINGASSVAFDAASETVYIVGRDSVFTYSVPSAKIKSYRYKSGDQFLTRGNQSFFDNTAKKLLNLNIEHQQVASIDTNDLNWSLQHKTDLYETDYWHHNKFYSPADTSIYMIGGYGQFFYKNAVQRYNIKTHTWQKVATTGDTLVPRYLSALGASGNGAYILGGYGSSTGQQILNPRNLYDLVYFDARKHSFKKIYELNIKGEDFVFANSLIINKQTDSYYALVFPKHKYNSNLQLISGSLSKPTFTRLGNHIPYTFHDIRSFADLFYCPRTKSFIAVTQLFDGKGKTRVSLFSLYAPPLPAGDDNASSVKSFGRNYIWYIIAALVFIAGIILLRKVLMASRKAVKGDEQTAAATNPQAAQQALQAKPVADKPAVISNSVFLFGDLQLFDNEGNDITRHLTPLTKELFLIIILYTIRWGRGITSEKLKEILWFDKTAESARNNRSVNIAKLKNMLDKMRSCQIMKESGHWKIEMDTNEVYIDYRSYLDIVKDKRLLDRNKIAELSNIIQRGNFLADVEYEWLDSFKSEISNEIIDTYLHYAGSVNVKDDPEFMIKLANYIFYFDPVNEEAMAIKCRSLIALGKHSLAKNAYDTFCREYKTIYGEDFEKDFNSFIE